MEIFPIPGFWEPVNSLLHLVAAVVFTILMIPLLKRAKGFPRRRRLVCFFTISSVFVLSMSGVFHMLKQETTAAIVMQRLDRAAIFILIAGTFTPVHVLTFSGPVKWIGLALMWTAAITALTLTTIFHDDMAWALGTTLYLALGWLAGIPAINIFRKSGFRGIKYLLFGGLAYSAGALLLAIEWPILIHGVVGPHELWHVAVIAGITFHWIAIYQIADRKPHVRPGAQPASSPPTLAPST